MDIRIYTDLEDVNCISIDASSLLNAYKYACQCKEIKIANKLKTQFVQGTEKNKISKTSEVYAFLKTIPNIKVDEINWELIMQAFLVARIQNNKSALRSLGTALGHLETYLEEGNELEGLSQELISLPKEMHEYIRTNHDVKKYEQKVKQSKQKVKPITTNRSVVEMGVYEKIYKKSA